MHLINYVLHLADNALVLGHRNSEWTGHGPILEQDIAISNIALDLIGQSRNFYQYAALLINEQDSSLFQPPTGRKVDEDVLAFHRGVTDFKNCQLVEQPNGDWAQTILKQFYFSTHQYFLFKSLMTCRDEQIAAIAAKSIKETTYHVRWSSEWVIRLGDGTEESHGRIKNAITGLASFTPELYSVAPFEQALLNEGVVEGLSDIAELWLQKVNEVFEEATLEFPRQVFDVTHGKQGIHTEHLGELLEEMQYLQRAYPDATW